MVIHGGNPGTESGLQAVRAIFFGIAPLVALTAEIDAIQTDWDAGWGEGFRT